MKTNLLTIVSLFTLAFSNAQVKEKGAIEVTPKIGYSSFAEVSNVNGKTGTTDSNSGLSIATTLDYYFTKSWSIRSGFSFDKMGSKSTVSGNKYEDKLYYLSVPVNANWHFGSTKKWNLNFGFSPSFLTSSKVVVNSTEGDFQKDALKSFQLGLSYGIGYKIEINKKFGILIDAQFFSGLTDINNTTYIPGSYRNAGGGYNLGAVIEL